MEPDGLRLASTSSLQSTFYCFRGGGGGLVVQILRISELLFDQEDGIPGHPGNPHDGLHILPNGGANPDPAITVFAGSTSTE